MPTGWIKGKVAVGSGELFTGTAHTPLPTDNCLLTTDKLDGKSERLIARADAAIELGVTNLFEDFLV
jgi:hypothetical protein